MRIMFLARDKEVSSVMALFILEAVEEGYELAAEFRQEVSEPQNLLDFNPSIIIMQPPLEPDNDESNEVELMIHAAENRDGKIPVVWLGSLVLFDKIPENIKPDFYLTLEKAQKLGLVGIIEQVL